MFKDIKNTTKCTNFHHDHITTDTLIRLQTKRTYSDTNKNLRTQEGKISRESANLAKRGGSIITKWMIELNVPAFAAHKQRIADHLLDGRWHKVDDNGNWLFSDGADDLQSQVSRTVKLMHIG